MDFLTTRAQRGRKSHLDPDQKLPREIQKTDFLRPSQINPRTPIRGVGHVKIVTLL
jgi:hypothetical protein